MTTGSVTAPTTAAEREHAPWLDGRTLLVARIAWLAVAAVTLGLFVVALPARYRQLGAPDEAVRGGLARLGLPVAPYAVYTLALDVAFTAGFCLVAAVLFWRWEGEPFALFVSFMLLLVGTGTETAVGALVVAHPAPARLLDICGSIGFVAFLIFFYLFPDGRFVPRWTRALAVIWVLQEIPYTFFPDSPPSSRTWPPAVAVPFLVGLWGSCIAAQIWRYRRVSGPIERQQAKWLIFGFGTAFVVLFPLSALSQFEPALERPGSLYALANASLTQLAFLAIPLSLGIAILRHRLFDIDPILNRTLVYGALTAGVVGIYVVVVGYLGAVFRTGDSLLISLVATGLVAVLFQPLRERLQRGVNRLMYGERDEPQVVLARLGRRLEESLAPEATLPTIVETVAEALKLPYAAITLDDGDRADLAAVYERQPDGRAGAGSGAADLVQLPLVYQGAAVGTLLLAPRAPGEGFGAADHRLLEQIARQAGIAAHAVRLTADLQRSRERLVAAGEEERRRLRRDLHDGLGPRLASLSLQLAAARNRLGHDPIADGLLTNLKAQTQEAVADVRRVVYALRPPALDELGLVGAIREHAARWGDALRVAVTAPDPLPPLPAAVEVAAYRIALEALTNVARHAGARECRVRLAFPGEVLELELADDGRGIIPGARRGAGLQSMRERAEELGGDCAIEPLPGGGTRVIARLPLGEPAVANLRPSQGG